MQLERFTSNSPGKLIECRAADGQAYTTFVPDTAFPALSYGAALVRKIAQAELALGRLHSPSDALLNADLLAYGYIRREAESSSRIEGTVTTLGQLLLFEVDEHAPNVPADAREVHNYVRALNYGIEQLSVRRLGLFGIRELHQILLEDVRGREFHPGRWRQTQVYIGRRGMSLRDATYVPPPPEHVESLLEGWERQQQAPSDHPELVRIAVSHYLFEAIHPFEDGIGRLLILLLLCERRLLNKPLLYLSVYFERHREDYYRLLLAVSEHGAWNEWLDFFTDAVIAQAEEAESKARLLFTLREEMRRRILASQPKARATLLDFVDVLFRSPYLTTSSAVKIAGLSAQVVNNYLKVMQRIGIVEEITGHYHHRIYRAGEILKALEN
jgi:Fic family protein